jgi:hypothetical protein
MGGKITSKVKVEVLASATHMVEIVAKDGRSWLYRRLPGHQDDHSWQQWTQIQSKWTPFVTPLVEAMLDELVRREDASQGKRL